MSHKKSCSSALRTGTAKPLRASSAAEARRYFVLWMLLLTACSTSAGSLSDLLQQEPESWLTMEIDALNTRVEEAVSAKEIWPQSPLLVTAHLLGGDLDTRSLVLEEVKNRSEGADSTRVVIIRDGLLDGSVRGDWHEIDYRRLPDSTWRVIEARVAIRCRRGEDTDIYQGSPCP